MRPISLVLSMALLVMLVLLTGLAGIPDMIIPDAQAQYATNGQYGTGGQYAAPSGSEQADTAASCQQDALNALSVPNLRSNTEAANLKLLEQYIKCGGTLASLPNNIFNTLKEEGAIGIQIDNGVTRACPSGDQEHCSTL